jgi:hypothetical protein
MTGRGQHVMNMKHDSDVRMLIIILSRVFTPCEIPLLVHESRPVVPVILFDPPRHLFKPSYEDEEWLTKATTIRSFFLSPPTPA